MRSQEIGVRSKVLFVLALFLFSMIPVSALSVTLNVPEKYQSVQPGDRLYFELAVKYPENPKRVDLRLNYEVLSFDGKSVAKSKALKAVETQASFIDFIILPEVVDFGLYSVEVKISDYDGEINQEVQSSFQIAKSEIAKMMTYIYLLAGGIVFLAMLVVMVLFRKK